VMGWLIIRPSGDFLARRRRRTGRSQGSKGLDRLV
jgi:hypothetical protein